MIVLCYAILQHMMLYRLGPHGSSAAPAWGAPLDPRGFIVLTLCYVMLCYAMSLHVCMYVCVYIYIYIYIYQISYHITLALLGPARHAILNYANYVTLLHYSNTIIVCYMLYYITWYYVMLCYVVLYYIILYHLGPPGSSSALEWGRRRLIGYLDQRVPSFFLAGSSRTCLSHAVLKGALPRRTRYPLS